jgi:3' exoribonuclease, RNase T-like
MRYFIDTEFIESGPGRPIYLLSIGIVAEDGREFYAVNGEAPLDEACDWVWQNVIPHINQRRDGVRLSSIRSGILDFIGDDLSPEFWAYFADYDWVVFCQVFGRMVDLPAHWPKFCMDIKQWSVQLGGIRFEKQAGQEHNALDDARDCRTRWFVCNEVVKFHRVSLPLDNRSLV